MAKVHEMKLTVNIYAEIGYNMHCILHKMLDTSNSDKTQELVAGILKTLITKDQ